MQMAPLPAPVSSAAFRIGDVVWYRGASSRPWPCRVVAKSRKPGRWILDVYAQTESALDGLEARMRPFADAVGELAVFESWPSEREAQAYATGAEVGWPPV